MQKIVVDGHGGDNSPLEVVKGCCVALRADKSLHLIVTGDEAVITKMLVENGADIGRVEVVHAPDIITNDDVPTDALRKKKDSSLVRALRRTADDKDAIGMISAGSTGAVLSGSFLILGRLKRVMRPGFAPMIPTLERTNMILIDCGANPDAKAEYLAQFAVLGSEYMKKVCGYESPRVALLSNGTEDSKGDERGKIAFKLLRQLPINFIGNVEARDFLTGKFEVLVADGFAGNVCLKSMEGTVNLILSVLKQEIMASKRAKIGAALFMKPAFRSMKKRLDYTAVGGATILGCKKTVVKAHGSSKANTITAAIFQTRDMYALGLSDGLEEAIAAVDWDNLHV